MKQIQEDKIYKSDSVIAIIMNEDIDENDLLFKLIKIYVVEYLTTVHGFKNFQHEAINMLALYIISSIRKIVQAVKRTTSLQGITMPNCLHLVDFLYQRKQVDILKLIEFLTKQPNANNKNMKSFHSGLQNLGRSLFSEELEQINQNRSENEYSNIRYIPHVYTYSADENPLPIRAPVDEGIKKPAQYTYKNVSDKVDKVDNNVEKLGNYSIRQMRRSLGILSTQEDGQETADSSKKGRKIMNKKQQKIEIENSITKNKFSMINYI